MLRISAKASTYLENRRRGILPRRSIDQKIAATEQLW